MSISTSYRRRHLACFTRLPAFSSLNGGAVEAKKIFDVPADDATHDSQRRDPTGQGQTTIVATTAAWVSRAVWNS